MSNIISELDRSEKIYLISHINPDGDSIGSLIAMGISLQSRYRDKVVMLKSDSTPKRFQFLKGTESLIDIDNLINVSENSTLITLDCGDIHRIGDAYNYLEKFSTIINFDHHISNTNFGDINIVNNNASSTGEIVYSFIKENNLKLDLDIANALYAAISTDTGSFKYENTTSNTHRIVAELLDLNISREKIITKLYQNRSIQKTNIFIEGIKKLEFRHNNRVGLTIITNEMMENCEALPEDTDGIVEFIRDTENIEVACIIKEINPNKVKISLRSKEYLDVSKVAESYGGGGHIRAAGCTIEDNIVSAKVKILEEIFKQLR